MPLPTCILHVIGSNWSCVRGHPELPWIKATLSSFLLTASCNVNNWPVTYKWSWKASRKTYLKDCVSAPFVCSWEHQFDDWYFSHCIGPQGWRSQPRIGREVSWSFFPDALVKSLSQRWTTNLPTFMKAEISCYLEKISFICSQC